MQKVRIKKAPQLGEQVDYSFYDSRYRNMGMGGSSESEVTKTMGPVPREEANIEVELGEVVVGDTNQDGFLELFTFTGKPHSKGGTPVNIPPGSFIFSNTKKLFIKDPAILKELFGLPVRKGGYSPAEIAKKYQINEYIEKLKNSDSDALTKRTAQTVLDKHLEKLGELALVQESMKGFPDGIPAIALAAAEKMGLTPDSLKEMQGQQPQQQMLQQGQQPMMQSSPEEEMMEPVQSPEEESQELAPEMMQGMMRYGGRTLRKYQVAGTQNEPSGEELQNLLSNLLRKGPYNDGDYVGWYNAPETFISPAEGSTFYFDDTRPVTVKSSDIVETINDYAPRNWGKNAMRRPFITLDDGSRMSEAEYLFLMGTGSNRFKSGLTDEEGRVAAEGDENFRLGHLFAQHHPEYTTKPVVKTKVIKDQWGNETSLSLSSGDVMQYGKRNLRVLTPEGKQSQGYRDTWKPIWDMFDNTQGIILTQDMGTGEIVPLEGEDVAKMYKIGQVSVNPGEYLKTLIKAANGVYEPTYLEEAAPEAATMGSQMQGPSMLSRDTIATTLKEHPDTSYAYDTKNNKQVGFVQPTLEVQADVDGKKKKNKKKVDEGIKVFTADDFKKYGGSTLKKYQDAGTNNQPLKDSDLKFSQDAEGNFIYTAPDGTIVAKSMDRETAAKKKDNYLLSLAAAAQNANTQTTQEQTRVPEEYGPTMKGRGFERTQPKLATYDLSPRKEKFIKSTDKGDLYQQPNGDVYMKQKGADKVLAIMHSDGSVTNFYEDRSERKTKDGKVIGIGAPQTTQNWKDPKWEGKYMDDVKVFESLINDPKNQNLRDAMYQEFRKIAEASPNSKELLAMSPEDALFYLMEGNRQNALIQSAYSDQPGFLSADRWDRDVKNRLSDEKNTEGAGINRIYKGATRNLELDTLDQTETQAFQAMYQAAQRLANSDEYKGVFKDFNINPVGVADQQTMGQAVSPVEGIWGNTTVGQLSRLRDDYVPPKKPGDIPEDTPDPEKVKAYYCVKDASGTGSVQSYVEGETVPEGVTTSYKTYEEAERACIKTPTDLTNKERYRPVSGEMWLPDRLAIMGALSQPAPQDYSKFVTTRKMATPHFAYALESPDTFIQSANSQAAKYLDFLGNSTAGNIAASQNFNNLGELAKGIGDVNNRNIQTVNNATYQNAGLEAQTNVANVANASTAEQQRIPYMRDYDQSRLNRFNSIMKPIIKGTGNVINTNVLEQSVGDQYSSDRNVGRLDFIPGTGRDVTNPYYGGASNSSYADMMESANASAVKMYNDMYAKTGNKDLAAKAAQQAYANMGKSARNPYANMNPYYGGNFPNFGSDIG